MILTRELLLVDIFFTRRLSKSLAFCEFASVNFEPCSEHQIVNSELVRNGYFPETERPLQFKPKGRVLYLH